MLFSIKLCVKEVEEEVNIYLGLAKHIEDGLALVLEPQKLLDVEGELLHLDQDRFCVIWPCLKPRLLDRELKWSGI